MLEKIKSLTWEFFDNFWIKIDSLEVINEEKNIFLIKIKSEDSWLLIWPNWKNLDHISNILKLILKNNLEGSVKIHIEINDYIKSKDDRLKQQIISKIQFVEKKWEDLCLPFYSPYDRKKIHSIVWEYNNPKIYTKSVWEWNARRLYICKKNDKITIDLDWIDI